MFFPVEIKTQDLLELVGSRMQIDVLISLEEDRDEQIEQQDCIDDEEGC